MTYALKVTGKVTRVERIGHTVYGNPIMRVAIESPNGDIGTYRISDNAGIVYGIENPEYRDIVHTFELTKAGRISGRHRLYFGDDYAMRAALDFDHGSPELETLIDWSNN